MLVAEKKCYYFWWFLVISLTGKFVLVRFHQRNLGLYHLCWHYIWQYWHFTKNGTFVEFQIWYITIYDLGRFVTFHWLSSNVNDTRDMRDVTDHGRTIITQDQTFIHQVNLFDTHTDLIKFGCTIVMWNSNRSVGNNNGQDIGKINHNTTTKISNVIIYGTAVACPVNCEQ